VRDNSWADPHADNPRPRTRGDCAGGERPCPWVGCKHHLYLDVSPITGAIRICYPDLEPWELEHTCSLDVADSGGKTLEVVGSILNLTRERSRQIETKALFGLIAPLLDRGVEAKDAHFTHPERDGDE
jgi:hypothetical protein